MLKIANSLFSRRGFLKWLGSFSVSALFFKARVVKATTGLNLGAFWKKPANASGLWSWGALQSGILGLGDLINRSIPVQVGTLSSWVQVAGGQSHRNGIRTDGTLWGWGLNNAGQLGKGDTVDRSSPIQIGTLTSWIKISGGGMGWGHGILSDGTLWGWGQNNFGQLGLGDVTVRSNPTQVGKESRATIVKDAATAMAKKLIPKEKLVELLQKHLETNKEIAEKIVADIASTLIPSAKIAETSKNQYSKEHFQEELLNKVRQSANIPVESEPEPPASYIKKVPVVDVEKNAQAMQHAQQRPEEPPIQSPPIKPQQVDKYKEPVE
jgi:hypothetical protein